MVWADSVWVDAGGEWVQVRTTEPSFLPALLADRAARPDLPNGVRGHYELLTVVTDSSDSRVRTLPTLYFNKTPVFASRSLDEVGRRFSVVLDTVSEVDKSAVYLLNAVEIDGRRGLYGRDFFNRAPYRRRLQRLGMSFSEDPFVRFTPDSVFISADFGRFKPDFVILRNEEDFTDDPREVAVTTGGALAFNMVSYRLGPFMPDELSRLIRLIGGLEALSAGDPEVIVHALRERNNQIA